MTSTHDLVATTGCDDGCRGPMGVAWRTWARIGRRSQSYARAGGGARDRSSASVLQVWACHYRSFRFWSYGGVDGVGLGRAWRIRPAQTPRSPEALPDSKVCAAVRGHNASATAYCSDTYRKEFLTNRGGDFWALSDFCRHAPFVARAGPGCDTGPATHICDCLRHLSLTLFYAFCS